MSVKEQMLRAIEALPDEATIDDVMERLYLVYKIERGLEQAETGQKITQAEARQRMAHWLS